MFKLMNSPRRIFKRSINFCFEYSSKSFGSKIVVPLANKEFSGDFSESFSIIETTNCLAILKNSLISDDLTKSFFLSCFNCSVTANPTLIFPSGRRLSLSEKSVCYILLHVLHFSKTSGLMIISNNFVTVSFKSKNKNGTMGWSV